MEKGQKFTKKRTTKVSKFDLLGLTAVNGINFKKAAELHVKLDIRNIEDLYNACKENKIHNLKGFSQSLQNRIKSEIELNVLWLHTQCTKVTNEANNNSVQFGREFLLSLVEEQAKENLKYID
tara:strand:+ start:124 stop:492 length:369 start_codon:yes stop_codon:yes gene_type:complete